MLKGTRDLTVARNARQILRALEATTGVNARLTKVVAEELAARATETAQNTPIARRPPYFARPL
jgi:hypothetical protein